MHHPHVKLQRWAWEATCKCRKGMKCLFRIRWYQAVMWVNKVIMNNVIISFARVLTFSVVFILQYARTPWVNIFIFNLSGSTLPYEKIQTVLKITSPILRFFILLSSSHKDICQVKVLAADCHAHAWMTVSSSCLEVRTLFFPKWKRKYK